MSGDTQSKLTIHHNPVEDPTKFKRVKLQVGTSSPRIPVWNPDQRIQVAIFFDGTCNNRDSDLPQGKESNIAKLYDLYADIESTCYKFYLEGVGTGSAADSDFATGAGMGRGIMDRIKRACLHLDEVIAKHPTSPLDIHVFGFSRGAATALSFVNQIYDTTWLRTGHDKLPFTKVKFLGLFDIVSSIGIAGTEILDGHDLTVHVSRIECLTHFTSRDEKRAKFPLTSIHSSKGSTLPANWEERTFPGVHSDVGGGYDQEDLSEYILSHETGTGRDATSVAGSVRSVHHADYLARIPCWAMYDAGAKHGVPWRSVEYQNPIEFSAQEKMDRITAGSPGTREDPMNGWTTFDLQANEHSPTARHALDRLKIHPKLRRIWEARNDDKLFEYMCNPKNPNYSDHVLPFVHDSKGYKDIRKVYFKGAP
jgi:hypothetical protein